MWRNFRQPICAKMAGVAIFVLDKNDKAHWLEVGRCYERFALQATALGIRNAFINQAVEVLKVRRQFARHLNIDEDTGAGRIDLIVRFGRGQQMPKSLRRPIEAVLIYALHVQCNWVTIISPSIYFASSTI